MKSFSLLHSGCSTPYLALHLHSIAPAYTMQLLSTTPSRNRKSTLPAASSQPYLFWPPTTVENPKPDCKGAASSKVDTTIFELAVNISGVITILRLRFMSSPNHENHHSTVVQSSSSEKLNWHLLGHPSFLSRRLPSQIRFPSLSWFRHSTQDPISIDSPSNPISSMTLSHLFTISSSSQAMSQRP